MNETQARFERVAMPHLDSVYRMARQLTRREADAEDLVQDTFLRAYRAFESFELRNHGAKPWLLKILHNTFYTRAGRESRQPSLIEDPTFDEFASDGPESAGAQLSADSVDWEQFDEELKAAVGELSPEYREVLLLWALEELSYKEIAEVCGVALGTVMSRLYRARQQVSRRLAAYADEQGVHRGKT